MSYNISTITIVTLDAYITIADLKEVAAELKGWPECNFIDEHLIALEKGKIKPIEDRVLLTSFDWCSEGSGRAYHQQMRDIAKKIHGRVEAVLIWEGGDTVSGLRIVDGVMTEPIVTMTLAKDSAC